MALSHQRQENFWRRGGGRQILNYCLAGAIVGLALVLTEQIFPSGWANTLLFFYVAVIISARRWGVGVGIFSTILSLFVSAFFLFPPVGTLYIERRGDLLRLLLLIPFSALIITIAEQLRRAEQRSIKQAGVLKESQNLISAIIESCNDAIISKTFDGTITSWNKAAQRMFGYSEEEALGRPIRILIPPELAEEEEEMLDKLRRGERIENYETERLRKDGSRIQVSITVSPIRDTSGNVIGASKIARDITESKRAEEARLESEAKYRSLFESTMDAVFIGDAKGNYVDVNPAAAEMLGLAREQLIGQHYSKFIPPEWDEAAQEIRPAWREHGHWEGEFPMRRADGSTVWAEYRSRFDGKYVMGVARDVTERRQAEERLRQSEERTRARADELATLMEAVPAVIFIAHDTEGRIITGNRAAHRILRMRPGGVLSKTAPEAPTHFRIFKDGVEVRPEDLPVQLAARGVEIHDYEEEIRFEDGDSIYLFGNAMPLRDEDGRVRGAVSAFVDITARKLAEEALIEADRRKDEFLAMLAHELRNPLAPISNAARVLRHISPPTPQVEQMHDMIERQTEHLTRLVDDLLDVSRITRRKITLRREKLDLMSVVSRAVETSRPLIDAARHQLTISLPTESVRIEGDLTRLAQVIANILSNAAKYTEDGGQIELSAEREGDEVLIRVRDNGIGIPADILPHIFDLFAQADHSLDRSQGGLGIGLTVVRSLVEMHGGRVEAHSDGPGKGSEFVVRLPVFVKPATESSAQMGGWIEEERVKTAAAGCRVLVVDDNEDSAASLALLLKIEGYEVSVAHDGPATLRIAREFCPQVVLLDIGLPGMNGYEVAREIRRQPMLSKTILVALTGYGQTEDRIRSKEAGFDHHFTKPVDHDMLTSLIKSYMFV